MRYSRTDHALAEKRHNHSILTRDKWRVATNPIRLGMICQANGIPAMDTDADRTTGCLPGFCTIAGVVPGIRDSRFDAPKCSG